MVTGLAVWSAGHDPATVPEQRDIAQVVPEMQRAVGVVFAAAGGPGRAVVLGELKLTPGCRITPVRAGVTASQDVTVYVRAGQTRADLEAIAAALPTSYRTQVADGRAGTRLELRADAGDFIGIDSDAAAAAPAFIVQVSSGCRAPVAGPDAGLSPGADGGSAGGVSPAVLADVLAALGAPVSAVRPGASGSATGSGTASSEPGGEASDSGAADEVVVRLVGCPGGGRLAHTPWTGSPCRGSRTALAAADGRRGRRTGRPVAVGVPHPYRVGGRRHGGRAAAGQRHHALRWAMTP